VSTFQIWFPAVLMLVLLALQTPITWSMAIASLSFFVLNMHDMPLANFAQEMSDSTESVSLLALPLFVLAGCVMNAAGITRRLLTLAEVLVGHVSGALAQMCTVLATLLGGLTASANADAAMLSKTIGVQMVERGYGAPFAAVITSSAAIITALIPPSIGLIIYGFLAEVSIGRLFAAGIVPGLLLAVCLMLMTHVLARKRGYKPQRTQRASGTEIRHATIDGLWALSIPMVILLGTRYGVFTTTESGAIVVIYVVLIAIYGYREMNWRQLPEIMAESVRDSASVMLMICAAGAFGFYLSWDQLPQTMSGWIAGTTQNPILLLLLINLMLILLGTAIEGSAALIILTPMLLPLIDGAHIDKVHFGIVLITNLTIAGVTPPVGGLMYISSQTLKVTMGQYSREIAPYLGVMMILLVLLSLFPQISLWLPNLMFATGNVQ
jgi:tripartite ATP-independent transporter DctM subunit